MGRLFTWGQSGRFIQGQGIHGIQQIQLVPHKQKEIHLVEQFDPVCLPDSLAPMDPANWF